MFNAFISYRKNRWIVRCVKSGEYVAPDYVFMHIQLSKSDMTYGPGYRTRAYMVSKFLANMYAGPPQKSYMLEHLRMIIQEIFKHDAEYVLHTLHNQLASKADQIGLAGADRTVNFGPWFTHIAKYGSNEDVVDAAYLELDVLAYRAARRALRDVGDYDIPKIMYVLNCKSMSPLAFRRVNAVLEEKTESTSFCVTIP